MITILNTSILTAFGSFSYREIEIDEAKNLAESGFKSAIGHESTSQIISELLKIECPVNRIQYSQNVGDKALVFKLKARAQEGKILSREEIEIIGYEWGVLERIA